MTYEVVIIRSAQRDLEAIHDYVAAHADVDTARQYVDRIVRTCMTLTEFPNRGTSRDHLRPNLRTIAFERRATIGYEVQGDIVRIVQVLHAGRDLEAGFAIS